MFLQIPSVVVFYTSQSVNQTVQFEQFNSRGGGRFFRDLTSVKLQREKIRSIWERRKRIEVEEFRRKAVYFHSVAFKMKYLPEWVDCLPVEGCVADCGALVVWSSLLWPLLVALIGLSMLLATLFTLTLVLAKPRDVTGLGLGENNEWPVEYAWVDFVSTGETHISSNGIRPRDSTSPGVLWHRPIAAASLYRSRKMCHGRCIEFVFRGSNVVL